MLNLNLICQLLHHPHYGLSRKSRAARESLTFMRQCRTTDAGGRGGAGLMERSWQLLAHMLNPHLFRDRGDSTRVVTTAQSRADFYTTLGIIYAA